MKIISQLHVPLLPFFVILSSHLNLLRAKHSSDLRFTAFVGVTEETYSQLKSQGSPSRYGGCCLNADKQVRVEILST